MTCRILVKKIEYLIIDERKIDAVSALNIFSPKLIGIAPKLESKFTSSTSNPPSGPTIKPMFISSLFLPLSFISFFFSLKIKFMSLKTLFFLNFKKFISLTSLLSTPKTLINLHIL